MTIFLLLAFIEIIFKLDLLWSWMLLFMLGFGWYSRGVKEEQKCCFQELNEGKVK
jgi:hypothetical protein